jgi:hypothetical protein
LKHLKSSFVLSSSFFAVTMGLMVGCDSSKPAKSQAALNVPAPTDDHLKSVPNPDFLNWSKFPEGTKVVRQKVLETEQGITTITTTIRLVARQPKSVEVESQTTVVRPQETTENPPQSFTYGAEYKVPKDMNAEQFLLPDPKAKSLGAEKVTMLGKEYDSLVFKWQSMLESGPIDIKGWFSDDFPGRQIKTELDFKSDTSKGSETTLEVSIPEQK